jgi:hypothetical protein
MTDIQKRVLIAGIKIKLARGELIENILASYVKLTEAEKQEIREALEV